MKGAWNLCLLILFSTAWGQAGAISSGDQNAAESQQPVTTLKVSARMVAISAVVKSKDGEPRGGLTRDDFLLKQDGKEEPIRYFSMGSELPLTFALLVDTSGSQRTFIGDESLASDVFFNTMLNHAQDRAMLVQFDTRVLQLKGMTSSANALHLALSGMSSHASTVGGTLLYDAVYTVAKDVLAKETGRKAIVILSDGGDNGSSKSLAQAIEAAQRADVQIYSVLYSVFENFSAQGAPTLPGQNAGLDILQKLSETTGGHVFTVSRTLGLREIFAQISQDLRLQYELGYAPALDTTPNSYHKLEVRVRDKRLIVQARKGFFAPP